jgi:hypothetical protein
MALLPVHVYNQSSLPMKKPGTGQPVAPLAQTLPASRKAIFCVN